MNFRQLIIEPVKKRIPKPVKMRLRVYRYHAQLIQRVLAGRYGRNPVLLFRTFKAGKRVLFYPDVPWVTSTIHQICLNLGLRITNDPTKPFDIAIKWRDATFYTPDSVLQNLAESREVINVDCNDISKKHVDAIFQEVFGYSSLVDPRTYTGKCVQKSDLNAKHDGKIIDCPIAEPDEGLVYQILIDSSCDECTVKNLRLPVFRNTFPYLLVQIIPSEARFTEILGREVAEASDYFTREEQEKILQFCRRMGLDYGDLDIMLNRTDGRLYIIDVNNTPDGLSTDSTAANELMQADKRVFENSFLPPEVHSLYAFVGANNS